jgi:hypothetical protein
MRSSRVNSPLTSRPILDAVAETSTVVNLGPNQFWEFPVDDGLVLARPDVHGLYFLNSAARLLWKVLSQGGSPEAAVHRFVKRFGIPADVARQDIEATQIAWSKNLLASADVLAPAPETAPPVPIPHASDLSPFHCLVNEVPLQVLLDPGDICDEIGPRLQPVLQTVPLAPQQIFSVIGGDGRAFVFQNGRCIGSEEKISGARAILLQAMVGVDTPAAILHAGGCGGILIAGQSGAGKTTLCAALMGRGLEYHCDDSAVLDSQFRVASAPFGLMLRQGSWPLIERRIPALKSAAVLHRWGADVRFLAPTSPQRPAEVNALLFVRYDAAGSTRFDELPVFESLLELQHTGFWVEHKRERIARFLAWLRTVKRFRLHYSRLEEAERIVEGLAVGSFEPLPQSA